MQSVFIGIDVSQATLDVVIRVNGHNGKAKTYANTSAGIGALLRSLPQQSPETLHSCLEATGQYGDAVAERLHQAGYRVSVINPLRSKRYAQANLIRNHNDQVDAGVLAEFCQVKTPRLWRPPSPVHKALRTLSRRLEDLQSMLQMEKNRLKATQALLPYVQTSLETLVVTLKAQIKAILHEMHVTIATDPELYRQKRLLQSIPGVGELTATRFLAELGDLREFADAKQLSAYLGLTPEWKSSGTSVHTQPHLSKKGPAVVRHMLYMPAIVARQHNPILQAFCQRLAAARKCEMSILGAAMHKLVHLMFGVVHSGKPFDPLYLIRDLSPS
jgi:transposase